MKTYSSAEILKSYPRVELRQPRQKWFSSLQIAKGQIGNKYEKIEMTMAYMKFDNAQEWDECFDYLSANL